LAIEILAHMMKTSWQTPHNCDKIEAGARDNFHVNDNLGPSAIHSSMKTTGSQRNIMHLTQCTTYTYFFSQSFRPIIAAKCDTIAVTTF